MKNNIFWKFFLDLQMLRHWQLSEVVRGLRRKLTNNTGWAGNLIRGETEDKYPSIAGANQSCHNYTSYCHTFTDLVLPPYNKRMWMSGLGLTVVAVNLHENLNKMKSKIGLIFFKFIFQVIKFIRVIIR